MKLLNVLAYLFVLVNISHAADPAPAPSVKLTAEELSQGWVSLFDGVTTYGIETEGTVEIKDPALSVLRDKKNAHVQFSDLFHGSFEVQFEVITGSNNVLLEYAHSRALEVVVFQSQIWTQYTLQRDMNAKSSAITITQEKGATQKATQTTTEDKVSNYIRFSPANQGNGYQIRNIRYRPLHSQPIFNGNNLEGWKIFTGDKYKSQFAVTANNEISVKNGPGDLQTTSKYKDFFLQLECKTNGMALNSGIFFRCLPDQYQQGYEAQIQNGVFKNDATKPMDFGTGAIYRRQPARRVMAKDNEWFHLTVMAVGPRLRTWVNGYPAVDWKDDRKPAENARQGLYTKEGHISIQGHDPTTDLLFRNFKIVDLSLTK